MANPKHYKLLKSGATAWNQWRKDEPDVWPDLIGASLRNLSLDGVNLENGNLHRADLEHTSLIDANLRNANLKDSILRSANLQATTLQEANLYGADLREANLEGTDLRDANLSKARFDSARLHRAIFQSTSFDSNILTGALGIDTIYHKEPWSVDVRTLRDTERILAEKPHLREALVRFYRNAHVPEHLLADHFADSLSTPSWYTCFVSYSHQDGDFAAELCDRLGDRGIPYWRDADAGISVGSDILAAMARAIVAYDKVLLCCSEFSLTSSWVYEEIWLALDKEQKLQREVLLPLDIDGYLRNRWASPHAPLLNRRLVADFVGWRNDRHKLKLSFEQVARALRTFN